jgi:glucan phosphoethanolaminetransferase (alkaline phosphatase superfamily)
MTGIQYSQYVLPIAFALLAVASVLRWIRQRNSPSLTMLIGSIVLLLAIVIIYVYPHIQEQTYDPETNTITVHMNWWDALIPYLVPSGILVFSIGFLIDSKNSNKAYHGVSHKDGKPLRES